MRGRLSSSGTTHSRRCGRRSAACASWIRCPSQVPGASPGISSAGTSSLVRNVSPSPLSAGSRRIPTDGTGEAISSRNAAADSTCRRYVSVESTVRAEASTVATYVKIQIRALQQPYASTEERGNATPCPPGCSRSFRSLPSTPPHHFHWTVNASSCPLPGRRPAAASLGFGRPP